MDLRIKKNWQGVNISCPLTGKIVNTFFLDEGLYVYYYYNGYKHIFYKVDKKG